MNRLVLYEDTDVLVLNKPAGLLVHPDEGRTLGTTLVDWLVERYPTIVDVGERFRAGIVHRLDRETSGAIVVAKTPPAFAFLKKQFQDRSVEKVYHAFVYGRVKNDEGVINRPLARNTRNPAVWSAVGAGKGRAREAVTAYKVLARTHDFSLVELRPRTGRTHQLRVHMKTLGYPVVCDKLYAPKREGALGFSRLALHARSLAFILLSGKRIKIEAPYPPDFARAVENF
jgi:23S rRNA pseudouridine1911/1915/1917 synthase